MAAIYSNGDNRWNIPGFNFTKRDTLSSVYKISMPKTRRNIALLVIAIKKVLIFTCGKKAIFHIPFSSHQF
jgi:hypothetical protein